MTTASLPLPRRRSSARATWLTLGTIIAVAAIGLGTFNVVGALAYAKQHFLTPLHGPITAVDVSDPTGHVHLFVVDGNYRVEGNGSRGFVAPTHDVRVEHGTLVARTRCSNSFSGYCNMNLDLYVPAGVAVKVHASGGGINITGPVGDVDVSTSAGAVNVDGARGATLSMHSSGGSVNATEIAASTVTARSSAGHVELTFATAPQTVVARSSGGHVTVTVPQTNDLYRVNASSSAGGTHTLIRTDPTSSRSITVHSSAGSVTVQYPQ